MNAAVGIIARADAGGLAQMATEFVRGYPTHAALLVDRGPSGRGPCFPERIAAHVDKLWTSDGSVTLSPDRFPLDCQQFVDEVDVVYATETVYDRSTYALADAWGKGLVLHAMPELLHASDAARAQTIWLPTEWRVDIITQQRIRAGRDAPVLMPVPLILDDWEYRQRDRAEVYCAIASGADHDRNGTRYIYDAVLEIERPVLVYIRGGEQPYQDRWTEGRATFQWLPDCDDYHDVIPDDVDVLLMPRRYGGLCMPVREAAARGIPTMMTDVPPQEFWPACPDGYRIPTTITTPTRMIGGTVDVYTVNHRDLAATWDRWTGASPATIREHSARARAWAESLSWDLWQPRYETEFAAARDAAHKAWEART